MIGRFTLSPDQSAPEPSAFLANPTNTTTTSSTSSPISGQRWPLGQTHLKRPPATSMDGPSCTTRKFGGRPRDPIKPILSKGRALRDLWGRYWHRRRESSPNHRAGLTCCLERDLAGNFKGPSSDEAHGKMIHVRGEHPPLRSGFSLLLGRDPWHSRLVGRRRRRRREASRWKRAI